jgi:Amt family ammonium transporter
MHNPMPPPLRGVAADPQLEVEARSSLRRLHLAHAAVLAAVTDAVVFCGPDGRIERLNAAAEQLLGERAPALCGRPLGEAVPLMTRSGVAITLSPDRPLLYTEPSDDAALPQLRQGDARPRDIALSLTPLRENGRLLGALLVLRDVSEQQRMSRQLQHEAEHDALTGLANRRALERRLRELVEAGATGPHAVLFVDLDHFKAVNDSAGHAAGDELLRELSARLRPLVRRGDLLARFGGDEFVLLLPQCTLEVAERIAETLRQTVDSFDFHWLGQPHRITASVGALDFYSDEMDPEQLLGEVDAACYAAKRGGRNRVSTVKTAPEPEAPAPALEELRMLLLNALEHDELGLDGQRMLATASTREGALELFLRLPHARLGKRLRAAQFLPLARQLRLQPQLDIWVLEQAWQWLERQPGLQLQLNLGEQSLRSSDYVTALVSRLQNDPQRASRLLFEVGEETLVGAYPHSFEFARTIDRSGAALAVDGFRGGMAAVEALRRLPLRQVKLDSRLVRAGASDLIDRAMVEATVRLATALGTESVACGVETEHDHAWLVESGVGWLQGNYLHAPRPLEQLFAAS